MMFASEIYTKCCSYQKLRWLGRDLLFEPFHFQSLVVQCELHILEEVLQLFVVNVKLEAGNLRGQHLFLHKHTNKYYRGVATSVYIISSWMKQLARADCTSGFVSDKSGSGD